MRSHKNILLIEDDLIDAKTVQRAMKDLHITNQLDIVGNGEEGLKYLNNKINELPGIILLDLNMPKMNGLEFLEVIKTDDKLKMIPVVVLTTSREEQDKIYSFKNHVAGYMIKPVDYIQFVETIRAIDLYWTLSEIPDGE